MKRITDYIHAGSVLDLGAGNGRHAFYFAERSFDVVAVESDAQKLEKLREENASQTNKIAIVASDINSYAADRQFDVVVCSMVLHFLAVGNVASMIEKMQSWTKAGGYNVVTAYTDKNKAGKRPYLFKHNELQEFYRDWEILSYREGLTPWMLKPGETVPRRNQAVYLMARKSA